MINKRKNGGISVEEIEQEVESMIRDGLLEKRGEGLYPTPLGDFLLEYTQKVDMGLIEPGYKTWEKEYIHFIEQRKEPYIILKHTTPNFDRYQKWLYLLIHLTFFRRCFVLALCLPDWSGWNH